MKRIAVVLAIMAMLVYAGVTWGVDDETVALHKDQYIFWHGGPVGSETDGSEPGYGPDYLEDVENAMMGDLLFTATAADAVASNPLGLTLVFTHTLEAADGNDHNWLDGMTVSSAFTVTTATITPTLVCDPVNKTPEFTDGVATLTIAVSGDTGNTGTITVAYPNETLLGETITSGTPTIITIGSDAYPE